MYIQITTRCNMTCAHCCFNCTSEGEDMDLETFERALNWGDEFVCIGGGEPTMHKDFDKMLLMALASPEINHLQCMTNGTHTRRACTLAGLANKGLICAELSGDRFHDLHMVKEEVHDAFGYKYRDTTKNLMRAGRAESLTERTRFVCVDDAETHVLPSGDIAQCACPGAPIVGNVFDGYRSYQAEKAGCYRIQRIIEGDEEEEAA